MPALPAFSISSPASSQAANCKQALEQTLVGVVFDRDILVRLSREYHLTPLNLSCLAF